MGGERLYIALDLETTGLNPKRDAIIEIGATLFRGTEVLERFGTLVNPQRSIPPFIQQLTGIRQPDVDQAPLLAQVLPELLAFVRPNVTAVMAHNVGFDLGFLRNVGINFHRPALDTFELATILLPRMASYNLGELCRALDIPLQDAHRAQDDADGVAYLFMRLQERLRALPTQVIQLILESAQGLEWSPLFLFEEVASASTYHYVQTNRPSHLYPLIEPVEGPLSQEDENAEPNEQTYPEQELDQFFRPNGILAQQLGDGYEERHGQREMAEQVFAALNQGEHLIIEAGTGVGKSLAYLLPALLWSQRNGQRVVVATNTIALQDQLLDKEIPQVQSLLQRFTQPVPNVGQPLATLLKGRRNYLCMRRLHLWRTSHALNEVELRVLVKVLVWQTGTTTGDVSELFLPTDVERAIWRNLCSDAATCTPERCMVEPSDRHLGHVRDYFWDARRLAENAHLLVVNHALLLADMTTESALLPSYDHLIIDEAHRLEDAATDQQTYQVDWPYVQTLVYQLTMQGMLLPMLARLRDQATDEQLMLGYEDLQAIDQVARQLLPALAYFAQLVDTFALEQSDIRQNVNYTQRLALNERCRAQPLWSEIELEWESYSQAFRMLIDQASDVAEKLTESRWGKQEPHAAYLGELRGLVDSLNELVTWLDQIIWQPQQSTLITWLAVENVARSQEQQQPINTRVLCAPLHVNEHLESALVHQMRATILTGATLRTGDGFEFIQERLGLWHVKTAKVSSPFNYEASTLLYLPDGLPEPNHPQYQTAVEQAILMAASTLGGKTMALFTSYSQLRATADALQSPLNQMGIKLLQQGTGSRLRLLREYTESEKAVLLGTRTFWEGIDLPGEQLQCLLIARLPFSVPTDPLVAARSAEFDNPFNEYTLPEAILRFRQGFGRLIRRASDRGVVVLLDSRIWRKSYGQRFLDALPTCTVRHAPLANLGEEISRWLGPEDK